MESVEVGYPEWVAHSSGIQCAIHWWLLQTCSFIRFLVLFFKIHTDAPTRTHTHRHKRARARIHTLTHTRTHSMSDKGIGTAVKNSLEIIIKQVCLEGGFERGGRIRVAE